jgi:hypothetical protein
MVFTSECLFPCSTSRASLGVPEEVEHLTDRPFPTDRVRERKVVLDVISVAPTVTLFDYVAGFGEVIDDRVRRALRGTEGSGEVSQTRVGLFGDEQHRPSVIGEKGPVGHTATSAETLSRIVHRKDKTSKDFLELCCDIDWTS